VGEKKYDESAAAMIGLLKYGMKNGDQGLGRAGFSPVVPIP